MTLSELNELWKQTEESRGEELSRTTFNRHRDSILDIFGVIIECDRKDGYRYYIENEEVLKENSIQNWMFSTLSVGNMMDENVGLQERIILESIPSGDDKLQIIIGAMRDSKCIDIEYRRYGTTESTTFTVEPYCVKLFRRRWYVLVKIIGSSVTYEGDKNKESLYVFALDRIKSIDSVHHDAFHQFMHLIIINDLKRMILKCPDLFHFDLITSCYGRHSQQLVNRCHFDLLSDSFRHD